MVKDIKFCEFSDSDIRAFSPLSLAYIGDAVWEIYARSQVLHLNKNAKVNKLHKLTTKLVNSHAQFVFVEALKNDQVIDEELWSVVLRGRNCSYNAPKNSDVQEYNYATGFESMIGYLYLIKDYEKIDEIAKYCLKNWDRLLS